MDPAEQLRMMNRLKHAALPRWRRLPWLVVVAVPLAFAFWAMQFAVGWRLIDALMPIFD
jgi:cytoskeletal protein RodZ